MRQNIYQYGFILLVWIVVAIGCFLRIQNGDYFPIYQNDDSPFYIWLGNSIYTDFSHPSSLTIFEQTNSSLFWRSQYRDLNPVDRFGFRLTDKYFDHPFLATLLMALPARFFGFTGFSQIPQMLVRTPAFLAALIGLVLTYLLTKNLFGRGVGLLSLILLSVWPLAVFSERQSYLENFITPALLLGLLALWQMRIKMRYRWLVVLGAASIFASWTKLAGYTLFGIFAFWLNNFKQRKWSLLLIGLGGVSLLMYCVYGQLVGGPHFWWTITHQGDRGAYLGSIFTFFSSPQVQGGIRDGWWYIGLLGLLYLAFSRHQGAKMVGMAGFTWLLTAFFLTGPQNTSPWYIYPIYPLMMIGTAWLFWEGIKNQPLVTEMIIAMLGLTGWLYLNNPLSSSIIRLGIIGLVGLNVLTWYFKQLNRIEFHRVIMTCLLIIAVLGNILAIRKAPQAACGIGGCVQPDKIILQDR